MMNEEFAKVDEGESDDDRIERLEQYKNNLRKEIVRAMKKVKSEFNYIKFGDVVTKVEVIYDP